jgi:peroxin-3
MFSSSAPGGSRGGHDHRRQRRRDPASTSFSWGTTLVTTAFVAYGTYRLANYIYDAWIEEDNDDDNKNGDNQDGNIAASENNIDTTGPIYHEATTFRNFNSNRTWLLRRQRMKRCRLETIQALQGFLPTLCRIVEEQTKTTAETQALKKIREERRRKQQEQQQNHSAASPGGAATAEESSPAKQEASSKTAADDDAVSLPVTPLKDETEKDVNCVNNRAQEVKLWNVIKIQSFTRMMATAYAHTVLFLVLTVQVHLLGARLWKEQLLQQQQQQEQGEISAAATSSCSSNSSSDYSYQESHRYVLLHTYEYFFEQGLTLLIQTVERAVEQVLQDWNVLDAAFLHVAHAKLDEAIDKIRRVVEELNSSSSSNDAVAAQGGVGPGMTRRRHCPRNLLRFLMPPTATKSTGRRNDTENDQGPAAAVDTTAGAGADDANSSDDAFKVAQTILDETWDLLESPVLKDAQQDCLNATFDLMREESWGQIFRNEMTATTGVDPHPSEGGDGDGDGDDDAVTTTRPLAHILTQLKRASSSFYVVASTATANNRKEMAAVDGQQSVMVNSYCQAMEQLPSVLEVGDVSFN